MATDLGLMTTAQLLGNIEALTENINEQIATLLRIGEASDWTDSRLIALDAEICRRENRRKALRAEMRRREQALLHA